VAALLLEGGSMNKLKFDTIENIHDNWLVASCGKDINDDKEYIVTTDQVRCSELSDWSAREYAVMFANTPSIIHIMIDFIDGELTAKMAKGQMEEILDKIKNEAEGKV